MYLALLLLATLAFGLPLGAGSSGSSTAPSYSAAGIINSATYTSDALAPNAIASIYGVNLSFSTSAVQSSDIAGGMLPDVLAGVRVIVGGLVANVYFVSPQQINFLIPSLLIPGNIDLFVARDGVAGPQTTITLHEAGPGLYQLQPGVIAATHADGRVVDGNNPARPGEIVVLYGTGLGRTNPDVVSGQISMFPAEIQLLSELRVLVAGTAVDPGRVYYAGVTPGFPGLYQVNIKLPEPLAPDPEIRIAIGDQISPAGTKLTLR